MAFGTTRIAVLLVLLLMAVAGNWLRSHEAVSPGRIDVTRVVPGSVLAEEPMDSRFLELLSAETVSFRSFQARDAATVWVFLGYFARQKEGSQVHSPRHCYPGSGWSIESQGHIPAPWGGTTPSLVVSDGTERRMVMYWYQTPDGIVESVLDLKRHLTGRVLAGRAPEVVFARISTGLDAGDEAASERLQTFAREVQEQLSNLYSEREVLQ